MIVVLRIAIGWHFFYEGIHKFDERNDFSAKGFLGVAKGPTAPLFFAMLPDLQGLQRLAIGTVKDEKGNTVKDERGNDVQTVIVYEEAWKEYKEQFLTRHKLNLDYKKKLEAEEELTEDEEKSQRIDEIFDQYLRSLRGRVADVADDVAAFKASLQRHEEMVATLRNDTEFEQKRRWDAMMGYRREAEEWISALDALSNSLQSDMARVISPQLAGERGNIVTRPKKAWVPNPFASRHMQMMDLAVTYGLTAIGLCLILGFCTRLACLGGAAFLFNVFLTTWPVPGVYPPIPDVIGHFLYVSRRHRNDRYADARYGACRTLGRTRLFPLALRRKENRKAIRTRLLLR